METVTDRNATKASASVFIEALVSLNRLGSLGFHRFVFVPGMLFDRSETWWPGGGLRPSSHEGIDLCTFETRDGRIVRLDETVLVPAAFDGQVVGACSDFLGRTIILKHRLESRSTPWVYAFYAHIQPIAGLAVGDTLMAGQAVGKIAPVVFGKTPLPPHLHLTFARPDLLPAPDRLNWPALNIMARSVFQDPIQLLHLPCRIVKQDFEAFDPKNCPAVGSFAHPSP